MKQMSWTVEDVFTIEREYHFSAAHRIPGHPKCGRLHGHNYKVFVSITAPSLDSDGFVMDFGDVDQVMSPLIKSMDHRYLHVMNEVAAFIIHLPEDDVFTLHTINSTSAENLAKWIFWEVYNSLDEVDERLQVISVTVYETDRNKATYAAKDV